jgi:FAD/FMN-containing dehydrogenase
LTKLFVGSQGTLGLISNIGLDLVEKKPFTRFAVVFLPDLEKLVPIVENVLQYEPEAFECYDDNTFELAVQSLTYEMKVLYDAWKPILQMIETKMPKLILLIQLASTSEMEVESKFAHLVSDLTKFDVPVRVTGSAIEGEKYWRIRHESFNLLRHHGVGKQSAPFIDDIIVRPQVLKDFLPELEAVLHKYEDKLMYTIAGHIGDGNFHIIPLIDFSDLATREALPKIMDDVFGLVLKYGGSTAAEHNDGLVRSQYLCQQFGQPMCDLFLEIKNIFDPLNIFNPRKKVNVDMKFVIDHIKKTNVHPW